VLPRVGMSYAGLILHMVDPQHPPFGLKDVVVVSFVIFEMDSPVFSMKVAVLKEGLTDENAGHSLWS